VTHPPLHLRLKETLPLAALSGAAARACYWAAGPTLGLIIGGLFVVTFLTPAGVLCQKNWQAAIRGALAVILPFIIAWLIGMLNSPERPTAWMALIFMLIAFASAVAGLSSLLFAAGLPPIYASAITIFISAAILTWPVWLSPEAPTLGKSTMNGIAQLNPPLAASGVLITEPAWTERSIAYRLTNLDQDVPIAFPSTVLPATLAHAALAAIFLGAEFALRRARRP